MQIFTVFCEYSSTFSASLIGSHCIVGRVYINAFALWDPKFEQTTRHKQTMMNYIYYVYR